MKTEFKDPRGVLTPYRLHTDCCGLICLTKHEYVRQMCEADSLWLCPVHGTPARWDDAWYEEHEREE